MRQIFASVLIITRNKPDHLEITLKSLAKQEKTQIPFEVVIIDDGSEVDLSRIIRKFSNDLLIQYKKIEHQGIAVARNTGIFIARGEIIILTDDDVIVNPTFIKAHMSEHLKSENVIVVGDRNNVYFSNLKRESVKRTIENALQGDITDLLKQTRRDFYAKQTLSLFKESHSQSKKARWICFVARNVSARKQKLIDVGGFDSGFVGWGVEDIELGYRLYLNGAEYIYQPDAVVYHLEHKVGDNRVRDIMKNLSYFTEKHSTIAPILYKEFTFGQISLEDFCLSLENGIKTESKELDKTYYKMVR